MAFHTSASFEWGVHDCVVWPADCVLAITGFDPAATARGAYSDEESALAYLAKLGVKSQVDLAARLFPPIHITEARSGDLAVVPTGRKWRLALGVVAGSRIAVYDVNGRPSAVSLIGLTKRAFKVG